MNSVMVWPRKPDQKYKGNLLKNFFLPHLRKGSFFWLGPKETKPSLSEVMNAIENNKY